jgi:ribosomal protein S18 acetylase RimI-like enzyme
MAPHERAAVGALIAAAFADKYGPALGHDPALAAEVAAVLPSGWACYVGEQAGVVYGAGLLRFAEQRGFGTAEALAIWRALRQRQSLGRTLRSLVLLSLTGADHPPDPRTGYISALAVLPARQGQGLGSGLLRHMEAEARAAGKTRLALDVVDTNTGARRLYERHGFRVIETQPSFFTRRRWGYSAVYYMLKPIG